MGEPKETIEIRRWHDNDKYLVIRTIREEMTGEEILKHFHEIESALKGVEERGKSLPKQYEEQKNIIDRDVKVLNERLEAFGEHAKRLEVQESKNEEPIDVIDITENTDVEKHPAS